MFIYNAIFLNGADDRLPIAFARELLAEAGMEGAVELEVDETIGHPEAFAIHEGGAGSRVVAGGPGGILYGVQEILMPHTVVGAEGQPDFDLRGAVLMMLSASWAYQSDLSPEVYPWFFDRDLMRHYLDYMASARLNVLILWSGHLLPYILELPDYPNASQFSADEIRGNQEHFHWLTTEAARRNISVLTHFYNILSWYFEEFPNVGLYICPGESLKLEYQEEWFRDVVFKTCPACLGARRRSFPR